MVRLDPIDQSMNNDPLTSNLLALFNSSLLTLLSSLLGLTARFLAALAAVGRVRGRRESLKKKKISVSKKIST